MCKQSYSVCYEEFEIKKKEIKKHLTYPGGNLNPGCILVNPQIFSRQILG